MPGERIDASLFRALRKLGLEKKAKQHLALFVWDEIVGADLKRQARPSDVRDGILYVTVANSAWANQLVFMKSLLLDKLQKRLGGKVLQDIRFQVGRIDTQAAGVKPTPLPPLAAELQAVLEAASENVADPDLREKWLRLMAAGARRRSLFDEKSGM